MRTACEEDAAAAKSLMVPCLAGSVPFKAMALEGTAVGLLSGAAHSQVHQDNSRHFRGNYQRVSLNNQFPSAPEPFLQEKARERKTGVCWAVDNAPPGSSPLRRCLQISLS